MKKLVMGMILMSFVTSAQNFKPTATGGGNGGDAVVCGEEVFMLDYIETYGVDRSYEIKGSVEELSLNLINKLIDRDLYLKNEVEQVSKEFLKGIKEYEIREAELTSTVEFTESILSNIRDEAIYKIPYGCKVEQLIIRREVNSFSPTEFLVRKRLWDKMSNFQKAVGVLHEGLYAYMENDGQSNSFLARRFNSMILNNEIVEMSDIEYLKLREEFSIAKKFVYKGIEIDKSLEHSCVYQEKECSLYENGNIKQLKGLYDLKLFDKSYIKKFPNLKIKKNARLYNISFSQNGNIERFAISPFGLFDFNFDLIKVNRKLDFVFIKSKYNWSTYNYDREMGWNTFIISKKISPVEGEDLLSLGDYLDINMERYTFNNARILKKRNFSLRTHTKSFTDKKQRKKRQVSFNKYGELISY